MSDQNKSSLPASLQAESDRCSDHVIQDIREMLEYCGSHAGEAELMMRAYPQGMFADLAALRDHLAELASDLEFYHGYVAELSLAEAHS